MKKIFYLYFTPLLFLILTGSAYALTFPVPFIWHRPASTVIKTVKPHALPRPVKIKSKTETIVDQLFLDYQSERAFKQSS